MRALITGVAGHCGSHLADLLLSKGYDVYGTVRYRTKLDNIKHIQDDLYLLPADVTDARSVEIAVKEAEPDYIFHLAGMSFVPQSWRAPANTMDINVNGTINVLEAAKKVPGVRVQIAGSSEEYGFVKPKECPIKETNPFRPLSPYGVSKVAEDLIGIQYNRSYDIDVVVTRGFNHTAPRHEKIALCPNIAWQLSIGKKKIYVDSLDSKRDYTDTRDMAEAYLLALEKGKAGEQYNICYGKTWSIKEILDIFAEFKKFKISVPKNNPRPSDVKILLGNCDKFRRDTGWVPKIKFRDTIKDILQYWEEKNKK